MDLVRIKNVEKKYKNGVTAIYDLNLAIEKGAFVFVIGGSGSGKSTLIKMLYREEKPTKGQIIVGGLDVAKLKNRKVYKLRRKLGIVFQDYRLLPKMTVYENVAFALEVIGAKKDEIRQKVLKALEDVGLKNKIHNFPDQLSGGEQQRVAIARAIVNDPKLLLCDEPTGNLDPEKSMEIMKVLEDNVLVCPYCGKELSDRDQLKEIKEKYKLIANFRLRIEVVSSSMTNLDVFSIESDEKSAFINFLHITNGCITQAFTIEYSKKLDESDEELISMGIVELRERFKSNAKEIIVPFFIELPVDGVTVTVPQKGEKARLLSLSKLNVKQYKADRLKQDDKLNPEQKSTRLMKEVQEALHLQKLPVIIECFDNSNIQGSDAVSACVVFRKLKPSKKDYRKYNIKSVEGPDDYASMREIAGRRYRRIVEEGGELPSLILADGGKGQMDAILGVVKDELGLDIPVLGLVKNSKHKTSEVIIENGDVIGLKQGTTLFRLLSQIQDEVHRFAITFHRDKRSKRQTASELDNIKGIGEKSKVLLLNHFKSVKRIKSATLDELVEVIGKSKAEIILNSLK